MFKFLRMNRIQLKIIAITPFVCLLAFLCLGFFLDAWHPGWVVFLLIPAVPYLIYAKTIRVSIPIIAVAIFLTIGFVWGYWHPGWLVFLLIPIFEILFSGNSIVIWRRKEKKVQEKIDEKDEPEVIEIKENN